jgi:hypothetical protein
MGLFGVETPETVTVRGNPFRCLACQHDTFFQRRAQLHGAVATFFNVEWASQSCVCIICSECGHVHWFVAQD